MTFFLIPDVWRSVIAGYLTPEERLAVGGTCRRMHRIFPPALRELPAEVSARMRETLKRRGLDPARVDTTLRRAGCVLTGGVVLQAIVGAKWEGDIDLIIPPSPKQKVIRGGLTPRQSL